MAWISTVIDISFQEITHSREPFDMEFNKFSETDSDPISQWLKRAKSKGEFDNSGETIMYLLVELHRKVDELTKVVRNEIPERIHLSHSSIVELCWYEEITIRHEQFNPGSIYYGRLNMPIFPAREVPVFFSAVDTKMAKIIKMHSRDRKDWDSYMMTKERESILDMKGLA